MIFFFTRFGFVSRGKLILYYSYLCLIRITLIFEDTQFEIYIVIKGQDENHIHGKLMSILQEMLAVITYTSL